MGIVRGMLRAGLLVAVAGLAGCKSAQEKTNEAAVAQAKQQAAATGNAQQVVSTDGQGTTVTTVVQPPAPGQTTQQVVVTRSTKTVSGGQTKESTTTQASVVPAAPVVQAGAAGGPVSPVSGAAAGVAGGAAGPGTPAAASTTISPVDVSVPRGTTLAIRINQHISVKSSRAGDRFTGEVVDPVMAGSSVAIPQGTPVTGVVDASHRRGHFKGRSILSLRLTSMQLNGQRYELDTRNNVRTKKGKGKRSAAFIGGGAGLGMLVGGVASGGVGLLVGGLAGGGLGTALGGLTGNRDIDIPAESVMRFRLADDLVVAPQ